MIRLVVACLAVGLGLAGCATPPPTPPPTEPSSPSAPATPAPTPATATIEIDASGRYVCDFVAGCAPFVEITAVDDPYAAEDLAGWDPPPSTILAQTAVPDAERPVFEVGPPSTLIEPLPVGTYLVLAGSLWVDDEGTLGPEGPNANLTTGDFGVCRGPLEIGDDTGQASIVVTFHEDATCELETHAGSGARLDVEMAGTVQCTLFPYSCAAFLSVLPTGTTVEPGWRPDPHDPWWGAETNGATELGGTPVFTVPALPIGRHRLLISLLGQSDVVSFAPDGEVARDLLSRCYLDVDVGPDTDQVGVVVTFTPDRSQWGGSCAVTLAE